jgi:hypothetical protein
MQLITPDCIFIPYYLDRSGTDKLDGLVPQFTS